MTFLVNLTVERRCHAHLERLCERGSSFSRRVDRVPLERDPCLARLLEVHARERSLVGLVEREGPDGVVLGDAGRVGRLDDGREALLERPADEDLRDRDGVLRAGGRGAGKVSSATSEGTCERDGAHLLGDAFQRRVVPAKARLAGPRRALTEALLGGLSAHQRAVGLDKDAVGPTVGNDRRLRQVRVGLGAQRKAVSRARALSDELTIRKRRTSI